jgi:hypothetical protein
MVFAWRRKGWRPPLGTTKAPMTKVALTKPGLERHPEAPAMTAISAEMAEFRAVALEHGAVWLRDLLTLHGVRRPTDLSDAVLIEALSAGAIDGQLSATSEDSRCS